MMVTNAVGKEIKAPQYGGNITYISAGPGA